MNYAQALRYTADSMWHKLLVSEKRDALQAIENHIAQFEGRKARMILIENMEEGYYGYYNHADSEHIHLSPYALRTPEEAVMTTLHEGRHAYQHDCLDHNEGFPQPILDQFRDGFDHYVSPEENFKAYANNFTEVDAEDFAEQQCRLLNMEREAVMKQEEQKETSLSTGSSSFERADATLSDEAMHSATPDTIVARGYDWKNQSTYPELGREVEKIKGGSEGETLVTDLHDIPMSPHDFHQYYDYFMSDEVIHRPKVVRDRMSSDLKDMAFSLNNNDEVGYYESRDKFLELDGAFRSVGYVQNENSNSTAHIYNARKADVSAEKSKLDYEREKAVDAAWDKELERVKNGHGTWDWTVEQQAEMYHRGRVSGFEGSHMLSAKDYPEHAGNPDNIQLLPTIAHYDGVHERNPRGNTPNGVYNPKTGEVIPIEDGKVPALPEIELTDRYDPSQKEYHDAHPEFEQSGESRQQGFRETKERHPEKSLNSHSESSEETIPSMPKESDEQVVQDTSSEAASHERAPNNSEMNMAPSDTVQRGLESAEEMNMEPTVIDEHDIGNQTDHNMAPSVTAQREHEAIIDPSMNMAPSSVAEVHDTEKRSEPNMTPHAFDTSVGTERKSEEMNMAPSDAGQENISTSEAPSQEQGISW